jgi:hypothetical protein
MWPFQVPLGPAIAPLMWLTMAVRRADAVLMLFTHPGNWLCHTSVWPRTRAPFCIARWKIWLPGL